MPTENGAPAAHGSTDVTQALGELAKGESGALERLIPLVYPDLKRLARRQLRDERAGHTLNTTAVVHEAFLQLAGHDGMAWRNRAHFFAVASRIMRHILIDYARRHRAAKRAGRAVRVTLDPERALGQDDTIEVLALDEALSTLGALDARLEQVVECRFFAGLSLAETAEALGMGERTVERDWQRAKTYLLQALEAGGT